MEVFIVMENVKTMKTTFDKSNYVSKYVFTSYERGYKISAPDRSTVYFGLSKNGLSFEAGYADGYMSEFGLFDYYKINSLLANYILTGWKPKDTRSAYHIRMWAHKQTEWTITKRVCTYLDKLKQNSNPKALALHKKSFAALGLTAYCLKQPWFYEQLDPYIERDLLNYRAAMMALNHYTDDPFLTYRYNDRSLKEKMRNWRTLFSSSNSTYGNLNKTLDNLPGGLPCNLITNSLRLVKLERPITSRRELLLVTGYASCAWFRSTDQMDNQLKCLQKADFKQIQKCANKAFGEKYNLRKARNVLDFARYVHDGCRNLDLPRNITLSGMTDLSIDWHRRYQVVDTINNTVVDKEAKTALPPIDLPDNKHIKFLSTADAVLEEGKQMGHCISSYLQNAIEGRSYLFHVDYKNTTASVEVTPYGYVNQSYGPKNTKNDASEYGRRVLNSWAAKFPNGIKREYNSNLEDIPF